MKKQTRWNLIGRRWKKARGYAAMAWRETSLDWEACKLAEAKAKKGKR